MIFVRACDDHPAFAGGDVLSSVELKHPKVAEGARFATVIFSLNRVRALFDNAQFVSSRDRQQLVHITQLWLRTSVPTRIGDGNAQTKFFAVQILPSFPDHIGDAHRPPHRFVRDSEQPKRFPVSLTRSL